MDVIGERFGSGFQLLREIGQGARARVFLASDGVEVRAVKLFPPELRARAEHEVHCLEAVDHPNVVTVDAPVEIRGYPGVVMHYVAGVRMGAWLEHNFSRDRFLRVFDGVLAALGGVHAHGLVHRDVKPENILVSREAVPCLIDFDLAQRIGDPLVRRTLAGTVAYLSPRPLGAEPMPPGGPRSETRGRCPYPGVRGHRGRLRGHQQRRGRAVLADPLLGRLLAKGPAQRFDDAEEVRAHLIDIGARLPGYV